MITFVTNGILSTSHKLYKMCLDNNKNVAIMQIKIICY